MTTELSIIWAATTTLGGLLYIIMYGTDLWRDIAIRSGDYD